MRAEFLVVCDFAVDQGGKLTLLGTFDTIKAVQVPITLGTMGVGLRLRPERNERLPKDYKVEVKLVGPDGASISTLNAELRMKQTPAEKDLETTSAQLAFSLIGVVFPAYGKYRVELWVDGEQKHYIPIFVVEGSPETLH